MADLSAALQSAVARLARNPLVVNWDVGVTDLLIYIESVELTLEQEEIEVIHPIAGLYTVYVDRQGMQVKFSCDEDSADIFSALNQEGYAHSTTRRGFGAIGGTNMRTNAVQLQVRPYNSLSAETTQITLWKAVMSGGVTKAQGKSEGAWEVTFKALADEARADGNLYGYVTYPLRA